MLAVAGAAPPWPSNGEFSSADMRPGRSDGYVLFKLYAQQCTTNAVFALFVGWDVSPNLAQAIEEPGVCWDGLCVGNLVVTILGREASLRRRERKGL